MEVTYTLDPGPVERFGPLAITGLERLESGYVEGRIRWQRGAVYDEAKVEETRRALIASGLFSTVRITPLADPDDPGDVRMTVDATERLHRSIGVGLAYNTSQGFGARAFWENRNLFGNAENLRLSAEVGQQIDAFRANFRRPDFLAVDQDFLATAEIANDTPVAYNSRRELATAGIERRLDRWLTGGLSLLAEKANVTQLANVPGMGTQRYELTGLPAYIKLDQTDNLLNPTTGYRAQLSVTPARTFSGSRLTFATNLLAGSTYWALGDEQRTVLAGKLALGSLDGAPLFQLPADQRIYAGGGGSIRPYGWQLAGPLAPNKDPIGGRSSLVLNLEARIKITETIGVVPFVDAGSYYESPVPQLGRTLLYGVGIGARYYTAFGPLRLDLATPLHKRSADFADPGLYQPRPGLLNGCPQLPGSELSVEGGRSATGQRLHHSPSRAVSQRWRDESEVDRPRWRHQLRLVVPDEIANDTALLVIAGGSNDKPAPDRANPLLAIAAMMTRSVTAELRMVPNQPLTFAGETDPRAEDGIIAYSWDKYLRTGDETWPLRLPMTKSVVRAMDAITGFCRSRAGGGVEIARFVLAGASKRGWTAWTAAAVDRRVAAVVPVVVDLLNIEASFEHHYRAYGFWAPAIAAYQASGIMRWAGTDRAGVAPRDRRPVCLSRPAQPA